MATADVVEPGPRQRLALPSPFTPLQALIDERQQTRTGTVSSSGGSGPGFVGAAR